MKLIEETEHPIDRAMRAHPEIFTESARKFEGEAFEEALSRWAREFPEEAGAYEDSIGKERTLPMEILDYWDDIEEMAKRHPGKDFVEVVYKWMAEHPGVIPDSRKTVYDPRGNVHKIYFPQGREMRTTHRLRQI